MEARIYITDLAAYNNGALIGEWVDLPTEPEEIEEIVERVLRAGEKAIGDPKGSHEEIFLTDGEGIIGINEYSNPFEINETVAEVAEIDRDFGLEIYNELRLYGYTHDEAFEGVKNAEICHKSAIEDPATAYAYEIAYEVYNIPENLQPYFDYEKFGRDLSYDYHFIELDCETYAVIRQ